MLALTLVLGYGPFLNSFEVEMLFYVFCLWNRNCGKYRCNPLRGISFLPQTRKHVCF